MPKCCAASLDNRSRRTLTQNSRNSSRGYRGWSPPPLLTAKLFLARCAPQIVIIIIIIVVVHGTEAITTASEPPASSLFGSGGAYERDTHSTTVPNRRGISRCRRLRARRRGVKYADRARGIRLGVRLLRVRCEGTSLHHSQASCVWNGRRDFHSSALFFFCCGGVA